MHNKTDLSTNRPTTICLVGNPNSGKTTLFNQLTGSKQSVGNWPGVTVEQKIGSFTRNDTKITLVDLPGTYSIDVIDDSLSPDEKIARDYLITQSPDVVINIVDASNLERNLYLTTEVIDTGIPLIIALNMVDIVRHRRIEIDIPAISERLGCPVIPIVASKGIGLNELKDTLDECIKHPDRAAARIRYPSPVEKAISQLLPTLTPSATKTPVDPRWLAIRLLEDDSLAKQLASKEALSILPEIKHEMQTHLSEDLGIVIAGARYDFIHILANDTLNRRNVLSKRRTDAIDNLLLHRWLGLPFFLLVMYGLFFLTVAGSQFFIDFFDRVSAAVLVDGFSQLLSDLGSGDLLTLILANGIGGGVQVVITFIPIVAFLFLGLAILEDTGYMARGAFVLDRLMAAIGLPGKAFVPMLMGFGCSVPAILATRTLKHPRDRLLTIFILPFMSCGAKLPIYALFAAAFFPQHAITLIFSLYLIGIIVALISGLLVKNRLLPGESSPFFIELPTYHMPTLRNILLHTWHRLSDFIWGAGRIIVPMVLILNVLNSVTTDGKLDINGGSQNSVLSYVGQTITPLFSGIGITQDNWPASVGIFTGLLAKEATVGTLETLYAQIDTQSIETDKATDLSTEPEEDHFSVMGEIVDASKELLFSLPGLGKMITDPVGIETSLEEAQSAGHGTIAAMHLRFKGAAGAFAYLLFMLLYAPCSAAIGAVYRESNFRWTSFVVFWSTGVAYALATVFYQLVYFQHHPVTSTVWLGGIALGSLLIWFWMGWHGRRQT